VRRDCPWKQEQSFPRTRDHCISRVPELRYSTTTPAQEDTISLIYNQKYNKMIKTTQKNFPKKLQERKAPKTRFSGSIYSHFSYIWYFNF